MRKVEKGFDALCWMFIGAFVLYLAFHVVNDWSNLEAIYYGEEIYALD